MKSSTQDIDTWRTNLPDNYIPNLCFSGQACWWCFKCASVSEPLKRCGQCKRVVFCSLSCSKAAWPSHKTFCKIAPLIEEKLNSLRIPWKNSGMSYQQRHTSQIALEYLESEAFQEARELANLTESIAYRKLVSLPLSCGVCFARWDDIPNRERDWHMCRDCKVMGYCSKEHMETQKAKHKLEQILNTDGKTQCEMFCLSNEIYEYRLRLYRAKENIHLSWLPGRILSKPQSLPSSWAQYLVGVQLPQTVIKSQGWGDVTECLSMPLTVLSALRKLDSVYAGQFSPSEERKVINLHFLATEYGCFEYETSPAFEELSHQLPVLETTTLCFVGPGITDSQIQNEKDSNAQKSMCRICSENGKKRFVILGKDDENGVLGEKGTGTAALPDLFISAKGGMSSSGAVDSLWESQLKEILSLKTPLLVTSLALDEADADLDWIKHAADRLLSKLKIIWEPTANIWCGGFPILTPAIEQGYYRNNSYSFCIVGV